MPSCQIETACTLNVRCCGPTLDLQHGVLKLVRAVLQPSSSVCSPTRQHLSQEGGVFRSLQKAVVLELY